MHGMRMSIALPFISTLIRLDNLLSLFIATICFFIVFKTKHLAKLSEHKGISLFRKTFLFFGLASFFKFISAQILRSFFFTSEVFEIPLPLMSSALVIFFNLLAVIFLIYSISMKNQKQLIIYIIPFIITFLVVLTRNSSLYFSSLLFLVAYGIGRLSIPTKRQHKIFGIYKLLLFFWTLTIIDMLIPNVYFYLRILFYVVSLGLFLHILKIVLHILKGEKLK